jgi:esterase
VPVSRVVERGQHALVVWEWPGSGPPALLLHGVGNYGRYWDLFARAIAGRLRLVAPDARGHGDSAAPQDGYAAADFVEDAVAVLDAYGIDAALVVGHSMGGHHAIALAADRPQRVAGLVVVDAGPEALREGAERARRLSLERPTSFESQDAALDYLRATSPGYDDAVYAGRLTWLFRREGARLVWRSSGHALAHIFAAPREAGSEWDRLRRVQAPALVVRGTRSPVLAADVARRMVASLQRGALLELDAGHNVALDRPAELAEAVATFAAALGARGREPA